jgi:hypothetical protein
MASIPSNPDALLTRRKTAAALTEAGYLTAYNTLGRMAHHGTGPRFYKFGNYALYRWRDALAWAEAKLGAPRSSTREGRELDPAARDEKRDATAESDPPPARVR